MLDSVVSEGEVLSPEVLIQPDAGANEGLVLEPQTIRETSPVLMKPSPTTSQVRVIFLNQPAEAKSSQLPVWLHELIGWGVFLFLLAAFLSLQINLTQLFSGAGSQFLIILTVLAEIALLWGWDQYWY